MLGGAWQGAGGVAVRGSGDWPEYIYSLLPLIINDFITKCFTVVLYAVFGMTVIKYLFTKCQMSH